MTPDIPALVAEVVKLFRGKPSAEVHAALINVTADFVAGHEMVGDESATHRMRRHLIAEHFDMVEKLVDAYEAKKHE